MVTSTVNGRFPAGELTRRDPQLFAMSAILGDAKAHSPTFASYEYRQGFAFRYTTGRERESISPLAMAMSAPCGTARTVFTPPCLGCIVHHTVEAKQIAMSSCLPSRCTMRTLPVSSLRSSLRSRNSAMRSPASLRSGRIAMRSSPKAESAIWNKSGLGTVQL